MADEKKDVLLSKASSSQKPCESTSNPATHVGESAGAAGHDDDWMGRPATAAILLHAVRSVLTSSDDVLQQLLLRQDVDDVFLRPQFLLLLLLVDSLLDALQVLLVESLRNSLPTAVLMIMDSSLDALHVLLVLLPEEASDLRNSLPTAVAVQAATTVKDAGRCALRHVAASLSPS